ncbi:ATP-binding protein [Paracrocinitomix mangrovi]|uniref:sensor histidine kinase n=1 Tax=Paracrocinitomix mangrovi TaxID=2862509 RepID=UPI001C8EBC81|nr:ATP-binding protein [Paracrocinitomix mangrovi]UKN03815.1 ATP-binding protein [Paracrocinitomix mangrovi]
MKLNRPIQAIILGSILMAALMLVALIVFQMISSYDVSKFVFIAIPLLAAVLSFIIFSVIFQNFLNERIKVIYRLITKKKFNEKEYEMNISEDIFNKLEEDTAQWARTQTDQIAKLEEQAKFRREFLGNLAHELKTPVFSIQGYVLTLLEGGLEDEKVNRDFLERALNGVDRISDILTDLDEISKYEFDRFSLKLTDFDIVKLTKAIFNELEGKAETKKIKFEFNKSYDPIVVNADKGKIAQVLTNLITNSIVYGNEEGTTTIRFHDIDRNKILVEVADNGLGIAEDHLPRLFERFYRVDKSRARHIGGSGLGLAIVKHIVEAHGESISVRSTEGKGSTFSFTLRKV